MCQCCNMPCRGALKQIFLKYVSAPSGLFCSLGEGGEAASVPAYRSSLISNYSSTSNQCIVQEVSGCSRRLLLALFEGII